MLSDQSYQLLKTAAVESLKRIQLDRAEAPERLKPLLSYIGEHLYDPTLNVDKLKRACGVRDNSVPLQFHAAVGEPPFRYIESRRMETACLLLTHTDLKIWQVGELLGYSSIQVFSRAFSRRSGLRPSLYRRQARERSSGDKTAAVLDDGRPSIDTDSLRRALAGELPGHQARALLEHLLRLYPSSRGFFSPIRALGPAPIETDETD